MNIVIFMAIGCGNIGDELILKNEVKLFQQKYPDASFQIATYDLDDIFVFGEHISYFEYFPIGLKNPKNIWRNIKNAFLSIKNVFWADLVVFGGGGILFDNESWAFSNPLYQILMRKKIAEWLGKKIEFFRVSVDIAQEKNYPLLQKILSHAKVSVRDRVSGEFLSQLWVESSVEYDPVFFDNGAQGIQNYHKNFCLKKIQASDFEIEELGNYDFSWKKVWLALRKWYLSQDEEREYQKIQALISFLLKQNANIVLLPHSFHKQDLHANDAIFLQQFVREGVTLAQSGEETYENYAKKKIDVCVSMRLHSMILSQVYGIDFFALSYAKKTQNI